MLDMQNHSYSYTNLIFLLKLAALVLLALKCKALTVIYTCCKAEN